jgi:gametolysin peptidase M11
MVHLVCDCAASPESLSREHAFQDGWARPIVANSIAPALIALPPAGLGAGQYLEHLPPRERQAAERALQLLWRKHDPNSVSPSKNSSLHQERGFLGRERVVKATRFVPTAALFIITGLTTVIPVTWAISDTSPQDGGVFARRVLSEQDLVDYEATIASDPSPIPGDFLVDAEGLTNEILVLANGDSPALRSKLPELSMAPLGSVQADDALVQGVRSGDPTVMAAFSNPVDAGHVIVQERLNSGSRVGHFLPSATFITTIEPDNHLEQSTGTNFRSKLPGWDMVYLSGFENTCSEDSDGDGLANCIETNTGDFVSTASTGTNPTDPDTDHDGLWDGDEVLGTSSGLGLRDFGVSPVHKDILIEYDWFDDSLGCGAHSHRPTTQIMGGIGDIFANANVANPDGATGINVIQDYGQGGVFTGGNLINDPDGQITDGLSSQFFGYKTSNFSPARAGYFHYAILTHYVLLNGSGFTGLAEWRGDDFVVGIFCYYNVSSAVISTIVHELGHNLGLLHGGNEECNYKPNYNSVMNYMYNGNGDSNCDAVGDGVINYSYGQNIDLNEGDLNENLGICRNQIVPIDWNSNDVFESSISQDLNFVEPFQQSACGGILSVLYDYNDWVNLYFHGISPYGFASQDEFERVISCNLPVDGAK